MSKSATPSDLCVFQSARTAIFSYRKAGLNFLPPYLVNSILPYLHISISPYRRTSTPPADAQPTSTPQLQQPPSSTHQLTNSPTHQPASHNPPAEPTLQLRLELVTITLYERKHVNLGMNLSRGSQPKPLCTTIKNQAEGCAKRSRTSKKDSR